MSRQSIRFRSSGPSLTSGTMRARYRRHAEAKDLGRKEQRRGTDDGSTAPRSSRVNHPSLLIRLRYESLTPELTARNKPAARAFVTLKLADHLHVTRLDHNILIADNKQVPIILCYAIHEIVE